MKKITKENIKLIGVSLFGIYLAASTINGKVYNDFQKRIEREGITLENSVDSEYGKRLLEVRDKARNNPLYFPMGLLYDAGERRL